MHNFLSVFEGSAVTVSKYCILIVSRTRIVYKRILQLPMKYSYNEEAQRTRQTVSQVATEEESIQKNSNVIE